MTMHRLAALCFSLSLILLCPIKASAQEDIEAIRQRVLQFEADGNYAAQYAEAQKMEGVVKAQFGPDSLNYATALNVLSAVDSNSQGKYAESEAILNRVMEIYQRALAKHLQPPEALHILISETIGKIALEQVRQGKYADAETNYQKTLPAMEHAAATSVCARLSKIWYRAGDICRLTNQNLGGTLNNLAVLYALQGRYAEAEGLHMRALEVFQQRPDADPDDLAYVCDRVAIIRRDQGRYAEAEPLERRALAIIEQIGGGGHVVAAYYLNNLGKILRLEGRYSEAEEIHRKALARYEAALGPNEPHVAEVLNELGLAIQAQSKYSEAEQYFQRALAIRESTLDAKHPGVSESLNNLDLLYAASGDARKALTFARRVSGSLIAHKLVDQSDDGEQHADYFRNHLVALAHATQQGIETAPALSVEAFGIAQWANQTSTAAALQQTAARFAVGSDVLATLVRESQDLSAKRSAESKLLNEALAKPEAQQDRAMVDRVRKDIAGIEARVAAISAQLQSDFPDYAALSKPQPLSVNDAQRLLAADEALVFIDLSATSFVWVVTQGGGLWKQLDVTADQVSRSVAALRALLESDNKPFDPKLSFELYKQVLGPVADVIRTKPRLSFVFNGALTGLPPQLLVTSDPTGKSLRDVSWLIKDHAITILPSVASLKLLRGKTTHRSGSASPLIGFADPVFDRTSLQQNPKIAANVTATRAVRGPRGALADEAQLAAVLPALHETADELRRVAASVKATDSDLFLGAAATETRVKQSRLDQYRIVYFATHGLLAGEVAQYAKLKAEPALVLSLPRSPTDLDDGLLTASEVAQLNLNADWVVLSACNTASGGTPGAEALSGLARAFFYAGGRSLLVSHWAVDSDSTVLLMTGAFSAIAADPTLSHGEALRKSMLAMINDPANPNLAGPKYWAPFIVVGEPEKPIRSKP
jgi:CHAT domain-containing protein/tetratricopeptide (TPR) repeat protein